VLSVYKEVLSLTFELLICCGAEQFSVA
jgi:hypothetical protein